jgi:hypothetical protein
MNDTIWSISESHQGQGFAELAQATEACGELENFK